MDYETIANDLTVAYITKNGLPNENELEQIAKQLVAFYKANLLSLQRDPTGEVVTIERPRESGEP